MRTPCWSADCQRMVGRGFVSVYTMTGTAGARRMMMVAAAL